MCRCYTGDLASLQNVWWLILTLSILTHVPFTPQHPSHQTCHCVPPSGSRRLIPLQHMLISWTVAAIYPHRWRQQKHYHGSHMSCQIHATRSVRDSRGKNYCPVATVTPRMLKTPCRGLKHFWFVGFHFENHRGDAGEEGMEKRNKDRRVKRLRQIRDSDTVRKRQEEEGEKRDEPSLAVLETIWVTSVTVFL